MKILLTASVLSHVAQFHKPLIRMLKEQGHTVHVAAWDNLAQKNGLKLEHIDAHFNIAFHRSPFSPKNLPAYRQLRRIIEEGGYDIIHCNTPAVGVLTRLAARHSRKVHGTRVFYTAHGFHFYEGAPLKNWLLYYPIEKFMCRYTDTLVTITEEDARLARERFPVTVFHMHGVGADSRRFYPVSEEEKQRLRQQLRLGAEERVILCTGELLPNKNQATLIRAAAILAMDVPSLKVLLAGNGPEEARLRALIRELKLEQHVCLLGYCPDVERYVQAADIVVSCSFREGLPFNIVEGMMAARPIVASHNRGHRELVQEGQTGYLVAPANAEACAERILQLLRDKELYQRLAQAAAERGLLYADKHIRPELETLYGSPPHRG